MTDSNTPNDDSFIDPSSLKGDSDKPLDPAELIETLKQSEGIRWPGAIFLMALTLLIGFGLAYLLLFSRSDTDTVSETDPIEEPGITQPINAPPNAPIIIEEEPQTQIPLIGQQLINGSGTFTEWYTRCLLYTSPSPRDS